MSVAEAVAVQVEPILTGELTIPDAYALRRPSLRRRRAPCLAFVVRHPTAGTVLVDTGLHARAAQDLRADFGRAMGLFFSSLRPAEQAFDEQLRAHGVDPGNLQRVLMTHLHVDHTSGMRLLPHAEFVCSAREWSAATSPSAGRQGYVGHHLPPESRVRLVDFEREGEPHGPFGRTLDLLGDGSIRLIDTPGHTRGHMSILLRVAGGPSVLLVGDASYTVRGIRDQILPLVTADDGRSRRSLAELKAFADAEPDAVLVPSHDPEAWRRLR